MNKRVDTNRHIRIEGRQVQRGMYIHALHCPWLNNPFWRKSFLLTDLADRDSIRDSVPHVTIDLDKGRGLTLTGTAIDDNTADRHSDEPRSPVVAAIPPRRRRPLTELERVQATAERATAEIVRLFGEVRHGHVIRTSSLAPIIEDIAQTTANSTAAMLAVTRLKDKDQYTYIHSIAVATLMMGLARQLRLDETDIRIAGMAGLLHDIGKMHVAAEIVDKPGRLDAEELAQMRLHPGLGQDILLGMEDLDPRILDVCRHHHEKMDGTGYPDGLKGDQLSLFARISAVCDVYDAVTSIRSYKRAWSPHEALARMLEWAGHFDPDILRAFITSLGIQPLGALVRLHSNRLGIVVREGDSPSTPIVRIFFDVPDHQPIPVEDVATGDDVIIRAERGDYWFGERWPTLQSDIMADDILPDMLRHRTPGGSA